MLEIKAHEILVSSHGKRSILEGFDTIVLALGRKSVHDLQDQLTGRISELHVIGDASTPRMAINAIEEGARVALSI